MADSVFTKIVKGEIPAHKIYEDDATLVFLDVQPITKGHVLVIPKQQTENLWDVDDELYQHLMSVAKRVANHQRQVLGIERIGMIVDGFGVPDHVHIHLFPITKGLEDHVAHKISKPSDSELRQIAEELRME